MSPLLANLLADAEGPDTALMLPEVKAEDMRLLLQFIYQGEVVLPPRRTACLLDLAALLCVAGVRGGTGPAPPSPPRSDSPELDSSDRNESDHVSEDELQHSSNDGNRSSPEHRDRSSSETSTDDKPIDVDNDTSADENEDDLGQESNDDTPMNLAAKPEAKSNGTVGCPRPKPCSSSPPDFNVSPTSQTTINRNSFDSASHRFTDNYYQHPALQGCHPFSLELAVNDRNRGSRTPEPKWPSKHQFGSTGDNFTDSDVEVTIDIAADDSDREMDLSLKADLNRTRPNSIDEEKSSTSSELDTSFGSSESTEQLKGKPPFNQRS